MTKFNIEDEINKNRLKSVALVLFVFISIVFIGYFIGYLFEPGLAYLFLILALIFSFLFTFFTYYYSDKIVLGSVKARPANPKEHKYLINVVEGLALSAGIPTPRIYVIDSNELNAFATGRNPKNAVICVTTGLMKVLNRSEMEGVIAHEMSHIKNYDVRFATLVAVMVGIIVIVSEIFRRNIIFGGSADRDKGKSSSFLVIFGLIFIILSPIFAKLVQLAISRRREYLADANGAYLTRYPEGLASALEKIMKYNKGQLKVNEAVAPLFIVNPLSGKDISNLFSTHPPIEDRIKRLRNM
ncbi:MAG: M48 family metalloprotease [Candidatus Aenigmatarchaeota archaeon]